MKWKNFDFVYAGGSSLSAGGGLEWQHIRNVYEQKYGLTWNNEKDITYPKYIADYFGANLIHDAQSGSGTPRLIRRVYDYIETYGLEVAKKTLFILEFTDPIHRVDMWCEKIQDHIIVNVRYDDEGGIESISVQDRISPTDQKYGSSFFDDIKEEIKVYLEKFHNPLVYNKKFSSGIISLFSFFEQAGIDYFYMFDNPLLPSSYSDLENEIQKTRKLVVEPGIFSINHYCIKHKQTIKDELDNFTIDIHPGYFGNKSFAEKVIKIIEKKLKPKIWVFGDSFTQSFEDHYKGKAEWFLKYYDFKKEIPKNFLDILKENYNVETTNLGFNGCSNQKIYATIIKKIQDIKENDIVIVGWTSPMRFQIANQLNSLTDVIPFAFHPSPNDDISTKTIEEIGENRGSYNVFWSEIKNYIESINKILYKNKVYHWTWVEPESFLPQNMWSSDMINYKTNVSFFGWGNASREMKEILKRESDFIIDLSKPIEFDKISYLVEKNKKLIFVNYETLKGEKKEKFNELFKLSWYIDIDYQRECYELMIPFKEYETIYEETMGTVDDKHYSENGHKEFAEDLIKIIDNSIIHIEKSETKNVLNFDAPENRNFIDIISKPIYKKTTNKKLI